MNRTHRLWFVAGLVLAVARFVNADDVPATPERLIPPTGGMVTTVPRPQPAAYLQPLTSEQLPVPRPPASPTAVVDAPLVDSPPLGLAGTPPPLLRSERWLSVDAPAIVLLFPYLSQHLSAPLKIGRASCRERVYVLV